MNVADHHIGNQHRKSYAETAAPPRWLKFISYILEEAINLIRATMILTEDGRTKTRLKTNNIILLV